ncbi:hypothetical protein LTR94_036792, partial [Friedmanniomyces endolithicus]
LGSVLPARRGRHPGRRRRGRGLEPDRPPGLDAQRRPRGAGADRPHRREARVQSGRDPGRHGRGQLQHQRPDRRLAELERALGLGDQPAL